MSEPFTQSAPTRRTPSGGASAPAAAAALPRDLVDFLVELQIALHKHAIYPAEHPLVHAAVAGVMRRLGALFAERPVISIGVARRQLIIEGVATDQEHPLLRELAQRLHRHYVGALKLTAGISPDEVSELLATLSAEPGRGEEVLGACLAVVNAAWQHARLFPLTFDQLELVEEDEAEREGGMRAGRPAQLWMGLARAAMAAEAEAELERDDEDGEGAEPAAVAKAIEHHKREAAYDQVVVGYLLQIAEEVRHTKGRETAALQKRISRLVRSLSPETLATLLSMGGDASQRRRFVLDVTHGMSVDAVVEVVRAAASAERRTISESMLRLLSKIAAHAEQDGGGRRAVADEALREHVGRLVGDWTLADPNPDGYRSVLDEFGRRSQGTAQAAEASVGCEPERVLGIALDVGAVGPTVFRAIDAMLLRGAEGVRLVLELSDAPTADASCVAALHGRLVEGGALELLLGEAAPEAATIERLAALSGPRAAAPLLDALEASLDLAWRARLAEMVLALGEEVGLEVVRRLPRAAPDAQPDLLALLGRLPALPAGFFPANYQHDANAAVRREATRLALREVEDPPSAAWTRALRTGLEDADPAVVTVALEAAATGCPAEALPSLLLRVQRGELDGELAARAVRVVASRRDYALVPWLVQRVTTKSRWLKRPQLRRKSPELVAAVAALATYWKDDVRARPALALANASDDLEVRQALAAREQRPIMPRVPVETARAS